MTIGLAAYDQWQTDADDPSLSTSEKVERAGTVGTTTAGIIGGVAGSAAGQEFGSWIADGAGRATEAVVDWVGDAADATGDWVGDAADATGDALSDFGDALTFWD